MIDDTWPSIGDSGIVARRAATHSRAIGTDVLPEELAISMLEVFEFNSADRCS
jgi:hypothetical protein